MSLPKSFKYDVTASRHTQWKYSEEKVQSCRASFVRIVNFLGPLLSEWAYRARCSGLTCMTSGFEGVTIVVLASDGGPPFASELFLPFDQTRYADAIPARKKNFRGQTRHAAALRSTIITPSNSDVLPMRVCGDVRGLAGSVNSFPRCRNRKTPQAAKNILTRTC